MTANINMTSGSLRSGIFFFSLPLIISNLLQVTFNMADIAVTGRFAGSLALGAIGSTPQLLFFITGFLMGIGGAVNALAAYFAGAGRKTDFNETVQTSFVICLTAGIFFMILGIVFACPVLKQLHTRPELLNGAVLYIKIYMLGMPALSIYNFGQALLSATGDTKRPVIYLSLAGIINVLLNLLFVIVFKMSVAGVAVSSVVSLYIAAFLILLRLLSGKSQAKLTFRNFTIKGPKVKYLLKTGIPSGLQNAIFAFANMFIQMSVNSFSSATVAGISAASEADPIIYNVMNAFYTACSSFIGQNFGAVSKKRVRSSFLISTFYAFSFALILGLLLLAGGRQFLSLFTTEPEVIQAGLFRIKIMSWSYCISAFMDNAIAASRGLGKAIIPSIIVIFGSCFFRILWVFTIFARFRTIESLFLLYAFSWTITAIAEIIYFSQTYRKEFLLIEKA